MRRFAIALALTVLTAAAATLIPNGDIGGVLAILAIFVGLPVSILLYRDAVRHRLPTSDGNPEPPAVLLLPIRAFGALAFLVGVTIIFWVLYNLVVERQAAFTGIRSIPQLLMPLLLVGLGWRWLRHPARPDAPPERSDAADQDQPGP